jgi:hypothetical protein
VSLLAHAPETGRPAESGETALTGSNPDPQQRKTPPAQAQTTSAKKTGTDLKRPPIDASMVGYIENAIVGSELRIRFDAAFDDRFPDWAEFLYGKCGCYRALPPSDPAYDPHAPGPGPGIPKNVNYQELSFYGEYAPRNSTRFSTFFQLPFRFLQPQGLLAGPPNTTVAFASSSGISDVQAGLKFALLASPTHYLTAQLKSYFPSGNAAHGLGTSHYSVEPALLYYQRFSEKFELEGEIGGWLPVGGSAGVPTSGTSGFAGNIFFYGIGPSYRVVDGDRFKVAPVLEFVGWNVTGGLQTPPTRSTDGSNILNIKIGARMSFAGHNSVYVGYGTPLTSADWYKNFMRVEFRHAF